MCVCSYERQQLRSAWMEQLDGLAMEKKAMIDRLKVKEEFHLAKRALIQVTLKHNHIFPAIS